ncbi:MAG: shikimate kinase [Alphaproteobacteria bacterium]|nr:shikimate kinase [Alphaproteobacteria bacterium]
MATIGNENALHGPTRTIVLVGMMGSGKSSVGRKLAARLALPFTDSDSEVEAAAGCSVAEIFERYGEAEFRNGERRVIARLLAGSPQVLATGGGAFMDDETRALIKQRGLSVWLKADLETLVQRAGRRGDRPLLKDGDPAEVLSALMIKREPIYAEADIAIQSGNHPIDETVDQIMQAIAAAR